jgi:hypothetical protein
MARFDGRPERYDWVHVKGTDSKVVATFVDELANPYDLSATTITAVAYSPGTSAATFDLTTAISGAGNNVLTLTVADDASLPNQRKTDGTLDWALTIDFGEGSVRPVMAGSFWIVNPGNPDTRASSASLGVVVTTGERLEVTVQPFASGGPGIPAGGTTGQALAKDSGSNYDVGWLTVATEAQGELADSATQPGDLGTAAAQDVAAFDAAGSAAAAEAASQPLAAVLTATTASFTTANETKLDGVEALADVTDTTNVTAAGALMDSEVDAGLKTLSLPANTTITAAAKTVLDDASVGAMLTTLGAAPKASPTFTGNVLIPDADADGEALAYAQDDAVLQGLMVTKSADPAYTLYELGEAADKGRWRIAVSGSDLYVQQMTDDGGFIKSPMIFNRDDATDLSGSTSVTVPVPSATGHALRWNSDAKITNAEISVLKATSNVNIENVSPRLFINETDQAADAKNWRISPVNGVLQFGPSDDAGTHQRTPIQIDRATNQVLLDDATSVTVPVPTTTGQALRQGSDAIVAALTATANAQVTAASSTGGLTVDGTNPRVKIDATSGGGAMEFYEASNIRFAFAHDVANDRYVWQQYDDAGVFVRSALRLTEAGVLQLLNTVEVPVPTASGHALRQGSDATVAALTATGNIEVVKTFGKLSAQHTGDGTIVALNTTVGKAFFNVNGGAQLIQLVDDDTVNMAGANTVEVPVPSDTGHALRWGADATVAALTATGGIIAEGPFPRIGARTNTPGGNAGFEWFNDTELSWLAYVVDGADTLRFRRSIGGVLQPNSFALTAAGAVEVPAATAATHAAQVSAIDAATGRLAIGGIEMGSTPWRKVLSWTSGVQDATNQAFTLSQTLIGTGSIDIRRDRNTIKLRMKGSTGAGITIPTGSADFGDAWPSGFRFMDFTLAGTLLGNYSGASVWLDRRSVIDDVRTNNTTGSAITLTAAAGEWDTDDAWPTSLPGTAA